MKKFLLMGIAATAMLASCSQDETVEMPQSSQAIQFKSFVNHSTRANDITTANIEDFQVWGLMNKEAQTGTPFDGTSVTKVGSDWNYGTPVYWENGYKYSFVAIAPAATDGNWTFDAPSTVGTWGSIDFNNGTGETDLIYDIDDKYATTPVSFTDACPAAINFTFNHLLSRVKFAFANAMDDGSVINVIDVKIDNANVKATATLGATASWALAGDNTPTELSFGNVVLDESETNFAQNATKETDHKYMIPAMSTDQTYTVSFTVIRTHNGVTDRYTHENVELPAVDWAAGNSYVFVATLKAENITDDPLCEIVFTADVDGWEDPFEDGGELFPDEEEGN